MSVVHNSDQPLIPANKSLPELTLKVIIFSILLAAVLAASNAYLALKIGTTISASIPASVIAMGLLRFFKNSNVLECNMIQTAASGGEGVAAAISFVLPALIIMKFWSNFSYFETVSITIIGALFGVLFSIPLRRVLLSIPALRFPEGTAVGNVLRASAAGKKGQVKLLSLAGTAGGLIVFVADGLKVISSGLQIWGRAGSAIFGIGFGFSPALVASGYIIGFETCMTLLVGIIIGWVIIMPILSVIYPVHGSSALADVMTLWSDKLRYVGVGVMLFGGIWTLLRLMKVIINGLMMSFRSMRGQSFTDSQVPRTERDTPMVIVIVGLVITAILAYLLITHYVRSAHLPFSFGYELFAILVLLLVVLILAFFLSAIGGYLVGLIGSSNSPVSGIVIIALLIIGSVTLLLMHVHIAIDRHSLAALAILLATMVATTNAIALENIQDLKAGRMVGATPWKQQLILFIGVVVAAFVIAPVLQLLFQAYGIGGVMPRPGMDPSQMLAAPQAGLMSAIASGLIAKTHGLPWPMVWLGGCVAIIVIVADEFLKRHERSMPVLAVGLSIYLPTMIMTPIILGGVIRYFVLRRLSRTKLTQDQQHEAAQNGILLACGLVAGSALMGVILAIPFVILGSSNALRIMPHSLSWLGDLFGIAVFAGLAYWLYAVCFRGEEHHESNLS